MARDLTIRLQADRPGELAKVVQALTGSGVNIEGITEVDGVVHILARDPGAARSALRTGGYTIEGELEVLMLPMPDRPGELSMIMKRLAEAEINVRFLYLATDTRVVIGSRRHHPGAYRHQPAPDQLAQLLPSRRHLPLCYG